ncbi:nitroreductase [Acinetobacter equi]|uniref:Nitrobenzoate reductase n=1 Tax=Acinetobacter equi TaxID=1324350 RepID=A0A0N9W2V9_9GAMM|nr:nitroreductase [Acinetobacter equi]ALH96092.1 nitrobenzoate reductase [Acinetobacter equi]
MHQELQTAVDHVIRSRHSVRAFTHQPVETQIIKDILTISSRAPSGNNIQPWKVYVVTGKKREELIQQVCQAQTELFNNPEKTYQYQETFKYYPEQWASPFIERRRENGWGLYGLLDIKKGETEKMQAQHLRNYQLFDAPVGLFFTLHKSLATGSKMDLSMMIQNVMIAAKARGLDTCPQAAWNPFSSVVSEVLNIPNDEELICTVALGYADDTQVINNFYTPRIPLEEFTVFCE